MKKTTKSIVIAGLLAGALSLGLTGTASAAPTHNPVHNIIDVATGNTHGYNTHGYNSYGYNAHGYNAHGYNVHGYNAHGYNSYGYHINGHYNAYYNTH